MKATFQVSDPDDIECSVKITMPLRKWRQLRDQLNSKWPSWELSSAISSMLRNVEGVYYAEEVETD